MAPLDAPTCPTCGQTLKYDVLRPQTDPDWKYEAFKLKSVINKSYKRQWWHRKSFK